MRDDEEEASRAAIQEELEDVEEPLSAAQGHVHVTLGSVKKMQGFTPMTPEEHQEGNPLRSARPADYLDKKEGRLDSKKSSNVLVAIDEIKTTASLAVDIRDVQEDCQDEEGDLPELTDGDNGDSEDGNGCQYGVAGTISMEGYGELKKTEIYANMAQQPGYQAETSAAGAAAGDQAMQEACQMQATFPGLECWLPVPENKVLTDQEMCEAYHTCMDARSPLNTLEQMTVAEMCHANAGQAADRLGILPDYKKQRQMPYRRRIRPGIVTGKARDDEARLKFFFLHPQLRMEQTDVEWDELRDIPNIWELDQPLQNPEYYEGCWSYDFPRPSEYSAKVPIPAIHFEDQVQKKVQNSIEFTVPIGRTKMIPLYDVNIRRVVYLTQAVHNQLNMAAKLTPDLVDQPRGGPLIFTYMEGAEEIQMVDMNNTDLVPPLVYVHDPRIGHFIYGSLDEPV
eukprot:gene1183-1751_t